MKKEYRLQNGGGWNTNLKPAYEPIIMARKPCEGTIVENFMTWEVGGINIDECRVPLEDNMASADILGRYPANVITDGSDEVAMGMPNTKASSSGYNFEMSNNDNASHLYTNIKSGNHFADEGSAMRYFYCAKASKRDRDEGLCEFENRVKVFKGQSNEPSKDIKDAESRFTTIAKNIHPTVKPTALMQYLVRLVAPKGAKVLDCFNGSGSTGKACMYENSERNANYYYIGIEMTPDYLPISKARIDYAIADKSAIVEEVAPSMSVPSPKPKTFTLFDFM